MSFRPADAPEPEPTGPLARGPSATNKLREARVRFTNRLFGRGEEVPRPKAAELTLADLQADKELNALLDAAERIFEYRVDLYKYENYECDEHFIALESMNIMMQSLRRDGHIDDDLYELWEFVIAKAKTALDGMYAVHEGDVSDSFFETGSSLNDGLSAHAIEPTGPFFGPDTRYDLATVKTFEEVIRSLNGEEELVRVRGPIRYVTRTVTNVLGWRFLEKTWTYKKYAEISTRQLAYSMIADNSLKEQVLAALSAVVGVGGAAGAGLDWRTFQQRLADYGARRWAGPWLGGGYQIGRHLNPFERVRALRRLPAREYAWVVEEGTAVDGMHRLFENDPFGLGEVRRFVFDQVLNTPQFRRLVTAHGTKMMLFAAYSVLMLVMWRASVTARKEAGRKFLKRRIGNPEYIKNAFERDIRRIKRKANKFMRPRPVEAFFQPLQDFSDRFMNDIDDWINGRNGRKKIHRNKPGYNPLPFLKWYDQEVEKWHRLVKTEIEDNIPNYDPDDYEEDQRSDSEEDVDDNVFLPEQQRQRQQLDQLIQMMGDNAANGRGGRGRGRGGARGGRAGGIQASVVEEVFSRLRVTGQSSDMKD